MADRWHGKPPGSDAAVQAGCKCAVMDNCHGEGFGKPKRWWVTMSCPLHGEPEPARQKGTD